MHLLLAPSRKNDSVDFVVSKTHHFYIEHHNYSSNSSMLFQYMFLFFLYNNHILYFCITTALCGVH